MEQEYYVGVTWDGFARLPVMIFSDMGGIDIEEVAEKHPAHIAKRHFSTLLPFSDFMAKELVAARRHQRRRAQPARADRGGAGAHLSNLRVDARRDQPAGAPRGRPLRLPRRPRRHGRRRARQPEGDPRGARHRPRREAASAAADAVRDQGRRRSTPSTTAASPATSSSSTATSAW